MTEVAAKYHTPWSPDSPPDWQMHNRGVTPKFFVETIPLFESDGVTPRIGADGKPLTEEHEFVDIHVAGDALSVACHPVDAAIIARFEGPYRDYKEKRETSHRGYSFEECSFINE